MKIFAATALVGAVSALNAVETDFMFYLSKHGKSYANQEEYNMRLANFARNDAHIKAHDPVATGYTLAHNKFSDWTREEYEAILKYTPASNWPQREVSEPNAEQLGVAVNWIDDGCVN